MGGEFLPSESFDYEPVWTNFFENPALVQFNHRIAGYLVFVLGALFWLRARKSAFGAVRRWSDWVMVAIFGQVVLGVVTVINAAPEVGNGVPAACCALAKAWPNRLA